MKKRQARDSPLVSALIATYNRAHMVTEAIDSVLAQTYPNFEVIVVDDGSEDDTQSVIKDRYGDRVIYIYQQNRGLPGARNTSIHAARGKYIAFQDDDDIWLPTKLDRQVRALEQNPECAVAYCACLEATPNGKPTRKLYKSTGKGRTGDIFALQLCHNVIAHPSAIVRMSCLSEVGLFDEELLTGEDTDIFLRLTLRYPAVYIREPLMLVRQHPTRKTDTDRRMGWNFEAHVRTMTKLLDLLPPERERLRPLITRSLLWAQLSLLRMRGRELEWTEFAQRLVQIFGSAQDLRWLHRLSVLTVESIAEWQYTHTRPSRAQIDALAAAIGAEAQSRGPSKAAWQACIYCGWGLERLRRGELRNALGYLSRGTLRHPLAAAAHCVWTLARMARNVACRTAES